MTSVGRLLPRSVNPTTYVTVSVCLPEGAFCSNLMNGAAMFDRFMSSSLSFCIERMRLWTCDARVPAWKRATSWAPSSRIALTMSGLASLAPSSA